MSKINLIKFEKNLSLLDVSEYDLTIIIPAHNCERFIEEAICSAMAQLYVRTEVIIIDDGSSDNTLIYALKYSKEQNIKIVSTINIERSLARNLGLDCALADVCVFLDADDLLHPLASHYALKQLRSNESIDAVIYDAQFFENVAPVFDLTADVTRLTSVFPSAIQCDVIFKDRSLPINSVFFKKNSQRFSPGISICEDWLYWRRSLKNKLAIHIPFPGCYVRRHGGNSTTSDLYLMAGEIIAIYILNNEESNRNFGRQIATRVGRLLFLSFIQSNPFIFFYYITKGFAKALCKSIHCKIKK